MDISKESLLIAVGRGIQNKDNIALAEDLAKAMGGVVTGSRPVIDQGWLAASRLVGKSGKHVKPKIYLALGISGAPEHVEAITDSDTIIAVNTDPAAPIFNIAKYGVEVDMFDLIEALTDLPSELNFRQELTNGNPNRTESALAKSAPMEVLPNKTTRGCFSPTRPANAF